MYLFEYSKINISQKIRTLILYQMFSGCQLYVYVKRECLLKKNDYTYMLNKWSGFGHLKNQVDIEEKLFFRA